MKLKEMSEVNILQIEKNSLFDIKNLEIDNSLPIEKRVEQFINEIKNPYCFKYNETIVKIEFTENGKSLNEVITNHFISVKQE